MPHQVHRSHAPPTFSTPTNAVRARHRRCKQKRSATQCQQEIEEGGRGASSSACSVTDSSLHLSAPGKFSPSTISVSFSFALLPLTQHPPSPFNSKIVRVWQPVAVAGRARLVHPVLIFLSAFCVCCCRSHNILLPLSIPKMFQYGRLP